jgi:hypothetical protein
MHGERLDGFSNDDHPRGLAAPLSDEDRRTIARWIDLGCPLDRDSDAGGRGWGWTLDDNRPILTVTHPRPRSIGVFDRILVGTHDYGSGLAAGSLSVTADFPIDDVPAGENLAERMNEVSPGVREYRLQTPVSRLDAGVLSVSVRDRQGHLTRIDRRFRVVPPD